MLYREIIAVCPQIHTKHINTLCGQNVELLNVNLAVRRAVMVCQGNHCRFRSYGRCTEQQTVPDIKQRSYYDVQ